VFKSLKSLLFAFSVSLVFISAFHENIYAQDSIPKIENGEFTQFKNADGKISAEGYVLNGKPEGIWRNYYPTGVLKSTGNRRKHLLDGVWKFYNEDGILQKEISYTEEKRQGSTKTYTRDGFLVSDYPFKNDTIHGLAHTYHTNGRIYQRIPYVKGVIHGEMKSYSSDGKITSIVEYKNGIVYQREDINQRDTSGKKQGVWKEFYDNETVKSEGRFVDNVRVGYWKEYNKKGLLVNTNKYEGGELVTDAEELDLLDIRKRFHENGEVKSICNYNEAGNKQGICRYFNDTGEVIKAEVYKDGILMGTGMADVDGIKFGHWKEFYESGKLRAEGKYEAGLKLGEWVFYYENGKQEQKGSFAKGEFYDGRWTWYYPNGELWRDEYYVYGIEDGPFVEYSDSGTVVSKGDYVEGLETGEWLYQLNDHKEVGEYVNGQREGLWKHYYYDAEATVRFKGKYESGLPEGKHVFYYPSGSKMLEGKYEYGERRGVWVRYNRDLTVMLRIVYKDGKEVRFDDVKIKPK
jgi:antitoxin component YwqK of YwqJK toxin-antitoxin module